MADDIVTRIREEAKKQTTLGQAFDLLHVADEIERLRAENKALHLAYHDSMWDNTLIPIADALGVDITDEHGVPRRQFQMVEAIIKEARRG